MNAIETIRTKLQPMSRIQREAIATSSGVPFETLQKIAIGATENPRYATVEKLLAAINTKKQKAA